MAEQARTLTGLDVRRTLVVAAVVGTLAAPAAATEVTIVPNVSIGKVKLGMTLRQVVRVLGGPGIVNARAQIHGRGYVEYGWNFSTLWVGFVNTKGTLHAALIGTDIVGEKTKDGIGVGTSLAKVRARYHVACNDYRTAPSTSASGTRIQARSCTRTASSGRRARPLRFSDCAA